MERAALIGAAAIFLTPAPYFAKKT